MPASRTDPAAIALLVLDVDGVMTDGRLYFDARGEALKVFDVKDGHGIRQLLDAGVQVAIISGRRSRNPTRARAGHPPCFSGSERQGRRIRTAAKAIAPGGGRLRLCGR
jgi:hypothetical protein